MIAKRQFKPECDATRTTANTTRQIDKQRVISIDDTALLGKLRFKTLASDGISNVTSTVLNAIANSTSGAIVGGAGGGIAGAAAGALVGAGLKGAVSKIATTRSGRYAIEKAVQEATKAVRAGGSKEALAAAERRFIANKAAVKAIRDAVGNEEFQRLARAGIVASLSGMAQE